MTVTPLFAAYTTPFTLDVFMDATKKTDQPDTSALTGFEMQYRQIPCGSPRG